jgi:hypothetical protein
MERSQAGIERRVDREIRSFLRDHLTRATRGELRILLRSIDVLLDSSDEAEEVRTHVRKMQNRHQLDQDLTSSVDDFDDVARRLAAMKYAGVVASEEDAEADDEHTSTDVDDDGANRADVWPPGESTAVAT